MEFTLRDLQRGDFDRLWQIDQECFAEGIAYSRLELATYIRRKGSFTIVAEQPGKTEHDFPRSEPAIAGFIVAEASRRRIGHIISIDVLPQSRRFGLGSTLLAAAEARLRTVCCRAVLLEAAVDNAAALAFYKRHKYDIVKTIPRYYSNGVDAFMFAKDL